MNQLIEIISNKLLSLIKEICKEINIPSPAYCLVLAYDAESFECLPPILGIGLEEERIFWLKSQSEDMIKEFIWNPAEFQYFDIPDMSLEDDQLKIAYEMFNQLLIAKETCHPAIKLLNDIVIELMKLDWSKIMSITKDFVIYAVNLEGGDLNKNMKTTLPTERLLNLKAQGWL